MSTTERLTHKQTPSNPIDREAFPSRPDLHAVPSEQQPFGRVLDEIGDADHPATVRLQPRPHRKPAERLPSASEKPVEQADERPRIAVPAVGAGRPISGRRLHERRGDETETAPADRAEPPADAIPRITFGLGPAKQSAQPAQPADPAAGQMSIGADRLATAVSKEAYAIAANAGGSGRATDTATAGEANIAADAATGARLLLDHNKEAVSIAVGAPRVEPTRMDQFGAGSHVTALNALSAGKSLPAALLVEPGHAAGTVIEVITQETHFAPAEFARTAPGKIADTGHPRGHDDSRLMRSAPAERAGAGSPGADVHALTDPHGGSSTDPDPAMLDRVEDRRPDDVNADSQGAFASEWGAGHARPQDFADTVLECARQLAEAADATLPPIAGGPADIAGDRTRVLTLRLNPPEQGEVHVRLRLRGNRLSLDVRATDHEARHRIEGARDDLSTMLAAAGYDSEISIASGPPTAEGDQVALDRSQRATDLGAGSGGAGGGRAPVWQTGGDARTPSNKSDQLPHENQASRDRRGALYV